MGNEDVEVRCMRVSNGELCFSREKQNSVCNIYVKSIMIEEDEGGGMMIMR